MLQEQERIRGAAQEWHRFQAREGNKSELTPKAGHQGPGTEQAMGMGMEQVMDIEKADTTTGTGPGAKNNRNICGLGLAQAVGLGTEQDIRTGKAASNCNRQPDLDRNRQ